ncbi:MAG: PEP-CTERM sorting domain-containing protein [Planctomycetia bacterium]
MNLFNVSDRASRGAVRCAIVMGIVAALCPVAASAQTVTVADGDVQSNATSATIDQLVVTGTGPQGNPSTYSADAPLSVLQDFNVNNFGVFNVNADVTTTYGGSVSGGGVLNLNSGTLSSPGGLTVMGPAGSITRTGGAYSLGGLNLSDGASLAYTPADSVSFYVSMANGSQLTLGRDLDMTAGGGSLYLSGTGALVRNGYSYGVSDLSLSGTATLTYTGSDSISANLTVSEGGSLVLTKDFSISDLLSLSGSGTLVRTGHNWSSDRLSLGAGAALSYGIGDSVTTAVQISDGSTLTLEKDLLLETSLQLNGPAAALVRGGHSFSTQELTVTAGAELTFTENDDVRNQVTIDEGGQMTLAGNLFLSSTINFTSIMVRGSASGLVTGTFNYAADELGLRDGPSLAYRPGDQITTTVSAENGSTLTLERDLVLTNTLWLTGSGALVTGTHAYSAANLTLGNGSTLDYRAGDDLTGSAYVWGGATLTLERNLSLANVLSLSGSGALVRTTESVAANTLSLTNGATFEYRAGDAITTSIDVENGASLTLLNPLALTGAVSLSGSGSLVANGHAYSVGSLRLQNGATAGFGAGDQISGFLNLSGEGSGLLATSPLALTSLSIGTGSLLTLANGFSGTGGPGAWALSVDGDQLTTLNDYLAQNLIVFIGDAGTPIYDADTNKTYLITAVPEPSTVAMALAGLACGGFSMWRGWKRAARG